MKVRKQAVLFTMVVLFALNATVPVFAEDTAEKKTPYTIEYSKVEQTVLGNNLQVNSNTLSLDSLDNKNELKKKYENILDTVSKASQSLTAILNDPDASEELKTVAKGTSVTLSTLSNILDMQEDTSEDDFELTDLQTDLANYQIVRTAQSVFSTHYQLQYSINELTDSRALLENTLSTAKTKYNLKQSTSFDVAQAQDALNTLDYSITNLQNQSKAIDTEMNILLGHSYNDMIVFGNIPDPDTDYANKIDLDSDITAAQDASYNIKIKRKQRAILSDDTYEERDKRNALNDDMELELQNIGSSLKKQYEAIQGKQVLLTAEQQKLATAKLSQEQALKKYEVGFLSTMDYAKIRYNTLAQQYSVKAAMAELFQEIEGYKWIVRGLPALDINA